MGPEGENRFPYTGDEQRDRAAGHEGQNYPEIGSELQDPRVPAGENVGEEPVEDTLVEKPETAE
jgi:hypothetical protein